MATALHDGLPGILRTQMPLRSPLRLIVALILFLACFSSTTATFVEFENCLDKSVVDSTPRILQFVPLNVSAVFNSSSGSDRHHLNITVYGNVTGRATDLPYPAPDDPSWADPNDTFGKIPDLSEANNKYTTLFARVNFLGYTPWNADPARFCEAVDHGDCPLAPAFYANQTEIDRLPSFSVAHDLFSSYAFASLQATLRVQSGDASLQYYSCVTTTITPDLGGSIRAILRYLPLVILVVVGVATITAAIFSPWGSDDIFHWSSNFGRDEDLLRLITPGFGDCLQYIQFVVLTGSLSLNYPGFYQPAVSRVAWSSLMFNESFVTGGNGTQSSVDGIYIYRNSSSYGLDRMSQLVGMTSDKDIWADMIVWLVVIVVSVTVLTQIGFAFRWVYRKLKKEPPEDLRSKNGPFTVGNVVRLVMNFFLLPLTSLSFYQLVIAGKGPAYSVALAVVSLVIIVGFTVWLLRLFVKTRPRSFLFDDLLMVLAYGPLYNTYCDDAATFALTPLLVNIVRGIAIGAVQPSGIAQLVLLAISEIVLILTINAFRPFPSATSMNIYHTCFSVIRLIAILLSIAFVPSLGVGESSKGWIGYAILIIHACTMVFGFFLNAVQTLIEVIARLAGAGGRDEETGMATRGGLNKVFGMRQLSRRMPRRATQETRHSMSSNAAMLNAVENEQQKLQMAKTRSRSVSGASGVLLDSPTMSNRISQNLDSRALGANTPDRSSGGSKRFTQRLSGVGSIGGIVGLQKQVEQKDPYYRPPRRNTMDALTRPDLALEPVRSKHAAVDEAAIDDDIGEGPSTPMPIEHDYAEEASNDLTRTKTDYAVREVDFYYGVRGGALSSGTRKLKTGPADPTGPVSTATGWFKNLVGGKTKEKHKGFEVVRSARAPPPGLFPPPTPIPEGQEAEPYHDEIPKEENRAEPSIARVASPVSQRRVQRQSQHPSVYDDISLADSDDEDDEGPVSPIDPVSTRPPSLPLIESVGGIELPSRIGSESSRKSRGKHAKVQELDIPAVPAIPRKSSRRQSGGGSQERAVVRSILSPPGASKQHRGPPPSNAGRIPFANTQTSAARNKRYSTGAESTTSSVARDGEENIPAQHPSYTSHLRQSASSALGTHGADLRNDRPSNVGFVQQHRASDHIHHSPDSPEFEGSAAEIHGRPPY